MSIEATSAVWKRSRQKSGTLLVLLALADYTNSDGIAWPAMSTLARKARMSKRNAQRSVRVLEKTRELLVYKNQGRKGSNIYRILLVNVESTSAALCDTHDAGVVSAVSSMSPKSDTSVTQSVNKSSKERTPIVPGGDDELFWIKACFDCFNQACRPPTLICLAPH
jgi:hypothetical protein